MSDIKKALFAESKNKQIYMDYSASTPMLVGALEAMIPFLKENYGNPSSTHSFGNTSRSAVENARRLINQRVTGGDGSIFFTSGGTESNNWIIKGIVSKYKISNIITSRLEHHSILEPTSSLKKHAAVKVHYVKLHKNGSINYDDLNSLLKNNPNSLVSLMHGNNEIGNLTDLPYIGDICKKHGAIFHSDTIATIPYYPINLKNLNIDICSASSHKFYGPKGSGFIALRKGLEISPLLHGGEQERSLRGGTENVAGIVGMSYAFNWVQENVESHYKEVFLLKQKFIQELKKVNINIIFNGQCRDMGKSIPNLINITIPKANKETLLLGLDMGGLSTSHGSACMSGVNKNSHVIQTLYPKQEGGVLRLSFGVNTTEDEVKQTCEIIKKVSK